MQELQNNPRKSVLVVEDECLIRMIAVEVIEEAGFCVYTADDADEALQTLERRPDIGFVFTDVNMPGTMDGLELARRIGGNKPDVKVIVTSGGAQKSGVGWPPGVSYIAKPYLPDVIVAILRDMARVRIS